MKTRHGLWFGMLKMNIFSGVSYLGVQRYTAKISLSNDKSLNMFQKLGFSEVAYFF